MWLYIQRLLLMAAIEADSDFRKTIFSPEQNVENGFPRLYATYGYGNFVVSWKFHNKFFEFKNFCSWLKYIWSPKPALFFISQVNKNKILAHEICIIFTIFSPRLRCSDKQAYVHLILWPFICSITFQDSKCLTYINLINAYALF